MQMESKPWKVIISVYLTVLSVLSPHHDRLCRAAQEYLKTERLINKQNTYKTSQKVNIYHIPGIPGIPVAGQDCVVTNRGVANESRATVRRKQRWSMMTT